MSRGVCPSLFLRRVVHKRSFWDCCACACACACAHTTTQVHFITRAHALARSRARVLCAHERTQVRTCMRARAHMCTSAHCLTCAHHQATLSCLHNYLHHFVMGRYVAPNSLWPVEACGTTPLPGCLIAPRVYVTDLLQLKVNFVLR